MAVVHHHAEHTCHPRGIVTWRKPDWTNHAPATVRAAAGFSIGTRDAGGGSNLLLQRDEKARPPVEAVGEVTA